MKRLFGRVSKRLPEQFSIIQFMTLLSMEANDHREARNILTQWASQGLVTRISKNMYEQLKKAALESD